MLLTCGRVRTQLAEVTGVEPATVLPATVFKTASHRWGNFHFEAITGVEPVLAVLQTTG